MKKIFITTISNQRTLEKCNYATGQLKLKYEKATAYPITHLIVNNLIEGDEAEVLAINFPDNPPANYHLLVEEVSELAKHLKAKITITEISHGLDETDAEHINLFKELLLHIDDCSTIYADC
jgi:hypothetical protein